MGTIKQDRPPLIKVVNHLYRHILSYTDEVLQRFQLSSGMYPFLLMLHENEGISQNQISRELSVDKAMSARAVKRLVELGYIRKEADTQDSRAYKLYLTDEAKAIIPDIICELYKWTDFVTHNLSRQEKESVVDLLSRVLDNAKGKRTE